MIASLFHNHRDTIGVHNESPQDVPSWHVGDHELKTTATQKAQEEIFTSLLTKRIYKKGPYPGRISSPELSTKNMGQVGKGQSMVLGDQSPLCSTVSSRPSKHLFFHPHVNCSLSFEVPDSCSFSLG